MLTVYTIVGAATGIRTTSALAVLSLGLYVGFFLRQARAARPLLRPRLFRSRALSRRQRGADLMVAGMFGFQYIGAPHLQRVLGYGELATGTAFLPAPIAIGVLMLTLSARTIARFGPYRVLLAGLVLITGGMALLSRAPADGCMLRCTAGDAAARRRFRGRDARGDGARHDGRPGGRTRDGPLVFEHHEVVGGSLGLAVLTTLAASRTVAAGRWGRGGRGGPGGWLPAGVHGGHGDRAGGPGPGGGDPAAGRADAPHVSPARSERWIMRLSPRDRS